MYLYTLRGEIQMKRTSNGFELKRRAEQEKNTKKYTRYQNIRKIECHKFDETENKITHC